MKKKFNFVLLLAIIALVVLVAIAFGVSFGQFWGMLKSFLYYSFVLYVIGISIMIFLDNNNPHTTISWLLVLILIPYVGFILYILLGRNLRKKNVAMAKRRVNEEQMARAAHWQEDSFSFMELFAEEEECGYYEKLIRLLLNNSNSIFSIANEVRVLTDGQEKFAALFEALHQAKHHIHIEYYILRDDEIGCELQKILIKKAKEGIQVRLIYDAVGCWKLGKTYIAALAEAGVEIIPFYPVVFPVFSRELNYRNHRKIVVIDGHTGFLGGLNVGDEYLGRDEKFGYWRDTHLMIKGEGVRSLQFIFLNDWRYVSDQHIVDEVYFPAVELVEKQVVQIASSGPDSDWESIHQGYFEMITAAKERIWITTPYLVPDESIKMALKTAALSGVDVRIIIPSKPDHFFVYWASRDNIEPLLAAGVKIYTYQRGFIHAKLLIADGKLASVGTANLDMRSFGINYEVNAFIYDRKVVNRLEDDFKEDLTYSQELDYEAHLHRGLKEKTFEALGRIISPIQ